MHWYFAEWWTDYAPCHQAAWLAICGIALSAVLSWWILRDKRISWCRGFLCMALLSLWMWSRESLDFCLPLFYSVLSFTLRLDSDSWSKLFWFILLVFSGPQSLPLSLQHLYTPILSHGLKKGALNSSETLRRSTRLYVITSQESLNFFVNVILMLRVVKYSAYWKMLLLCPLSSILCS
jgi:hypothetical protein